MDECLHDYQPRADGIKEGCTKCGAARMIDPDRCNHDYQPRPDGLKYACSKCGATRLVLQVQDAEHEQSSPEVQ
jgi:predicted RNA-binding Zn-ribbon protein involved in translation (DUF1610 family)